MAGKSPTELIRDLQVESASLTERLKLLRAFLDEANLVAIRERLAVLDTVIAELRKRAEEQERRSERLAVLESQFAEVKKQNEEDDRRRWQVTMLFFGSLLTLAIQFAVL